MYKYHGRAVNETAVRTALIINADRAVYIQGMYQRWARATFFESDIAIPQLEGSTSAIAIPQLLKKCCSATATPQFRNHNFF